jgi:hypothetical protein
MTYKEYKHQWYLKNKKRLYDKRKQDRINNPEKYKEFNKGEIHIDHIRPCSSFDLTKPKEQVKCFHYTNTQPLWAKENLSKGAKLEWQN